MAVSGPQDFWIVGARVYFQREEDSGGVKPFFDLGVVQQAAPTIEPNRVELKDPDGGVQKTVASAVIEIEETYEIETNNFNPDNLALLFSATEPEDFTQSAVAVTAVFHAQPEAGRLIKLRTKPTVVTETADKDNSDPIYNIASIDEIRSEDGLTTYVEDDDYEVTNLVRGFIKTIPGGSNGIESETRIQIDYTPNALSGRRLIKPQTSGASVDGELWIYYSRGNNAQQNVRYAPKASLAPAGTNFVADDFSSMTFEATVLSDVTQITPAGELKYIIGDVPESA